MKATLQELWGAKEVLGRLAATKFKAKISYKLAKIIDQANKEIEPFAKVRQAVFEKYGDKIGETITVKPENIEAFKTEMSEVESQEIEFKFTVSLDEIESAELTPSELYYLDFLFREDIAASQSEEDEE